MNSILPPLLAIMTIFFPIWFFLTWFINGLLKLQERIFRDKDMTRSSHFSKVRKFPPGETA